MKPLKIGRQIFSWFCSHAIDEPLSKYQVWSREIFRFIFGVIFITITVASNSLLFTNHITVNNIGELFFGLYQFFTTLYAASAIIATLAWGPQLASLFRSLERIYNACKGLLQSHHNFDWNSNFAKKYYLNRLMVNPNSRPG